MSGMHIINSFVQVIAFLSLHSVVVVPSPSPIQLLATSWTAACQATAFYSKPMLLIKPHWAQTLSEA